MKINKLKDSIFITSTAWSKMYEILKTTNLHAFFFSASGGGCNGFNYNLKPINIEEANKLYLKKPNVLENNNTKLLIDLKSEFLLFGTTIDYINENYKKNIFESKFIFTPQKELYNTCGCGTSFSPK